MHDQANWATSILLRGVVHAGMGLVVTVYVALLGLVSGGLAGPRRLGFAVGILLLGLGTVRLVQYAYIRRHPQAGWRMMVNERDERLQLIRARAGLWAFVISSAMAITLLIWASFGPELDLPALAGDVLWLSLLVLVVVPWLVYVGSVVCERAFK